MKSAGSNPPIASHVLRRNSVAAPLTHGASSVTGS
jgi:hypothetical protein